MKYINYVIVFIVFVVFKRGARFYGMGSCFSLRRQVGARIKRQRSRMLLGKSENPE